MQQIEERSIFLRHLDYHSDSDSPLSLIHPKSAIKIMNLSFQDRQRRCFDLLFCISLLVSRATAFSTPIVRLRQPASPLYSSSEDEIGVGIDLGTTFSAVAILEGNFPDIISVPNNGRTMPSVVAFDQDGKPLVGREAMEWEESHKTSAYRNIKRVIGIGANHISLETTKVVPHLVPFVRPETNTKFKKKITLLKQLQDAEENPAMLYSLNNPDRGATISPVTVSSMILQKLLETATSTTQKKITRAVIGVPAYFNDAQREATVKAANLAGISKVKLLREPEAAALAYGVDQDTDGEELVLVFDLGGGTYDVSMLLVSQGLTEIVCTGGNAQLGGSNFDARVAQYFSRMTKVSSKNSESSDVMVRAAEQARIYLSNNRQVSLALPLTKQGWIDLTDVTGIILPKDTELEMGTSNSTHIFSEFTRKEMEALCKDEFQALLKPIREVAIMAGALLPGDARPSIVETALEMESAFTGAENFYKTSSDEEAALQAIQEELDLKASKKAQQKGRKKSRTVAKEERKYRAESQKAAETAQTKVKVRGDGISGRPISRVVLVGGATRMPAIGRLIAALTGVVPKKTIDPDEAVALGCAVHVGVLDGKEGMGTVLNPMQAAILRAVVEQQRGEGKFDDFFDDDKEFGVSETFEN